ncbi:MAG: hypothetical protein V9G20_27815 [Candidatus Promineifilaceae bacterium]
MFFKHESISCKKCRAIWQIARTIYQIVLQIFIPLGVWPLIGNSYENSHG